ncbi:hypothetical protein [Desulfonatronum sp. SC1]|uniref:hypothetical protein n=1 Tax=Desulfonatronum sp. SC1 TaxID=2109626 RepID=UPI0011B28EAF|nr:hypothetical protein [Desulfonatronum sp. SC1]
MPEVLAAPTELAQTTEAWLACIFLTCRNYTIYYMAWIVLIRKHHRNLTFNPQEDFENAKNHSDRDPGSGPVVHGNAAHFWQPIRQNHDLQE